MYPGTIFTIDDQSDIEALTISDTIEPPVQMIGFSSDKGTEDFIYIRGNAFFKQFGEKISFAKHGQPLLQAANAINNGGRLFCKRIVAPDSTLANIGIVAYVIVKVNKRLKLFTMKILILIEKFLCILIKLPVKKLKLPRAMIRLWLLLQKFLLILLV